ncbi:hypothetical protein PQQ85_47240, partial [Paraburkholderia sediminicola]|uniref:hypothetical protein n=1 Tax=Paraburkholderia sediminicola TaxID=458836 RepID=UPI0038B7CEAB
MQSPGNSVTVSSTREIACHQISFLTFGLPLRIQHIYRRAPVHLLSQADHSGTVAVLDASLSQLCVVGIWHYYKAVDGSAPAHSAQMRDPL